MIAAALILVQVAGGLVALGGLAVLLDRLTRQD